MKLLAFMFILIMAASMSPEASLPYALFMIWSSSSKRNWHQFLQIWREASWGRFDVIVMVGELRQLLWQPLHSIGAHCKYRCYICIQYSKWLSTVQSIPATGHRQLELHSSLISFLALVQNQFSAPDAVLLPAEDG